MPSDSPEFDLPHRKRWLPNELSNCGLAASTTAVGINRLVEWGYVNRSYCLGNEKLPIWKERFATEEEAAARQAAVKAERGRTFTVHHMVRAALPSELEAALADNSGPLPPRNPDIPLNKRDRMNGKHSNSTSGAR